MVFEANNVDSATIKPFRLVKFFSFSGLVVFLLFTVALSLIIANNTKNVLLEHSEEYAQVFAQNINHQVFQQFVLPTVLRYGKISLRNPTQFKRIDAIVRNVTHGLNIESVSILDTADNIITYSTVPERVARHGTGGIEYEMALAGKSSSKLITNGTILNLLPGQALITCQLKTYIPFRSERPLGQSTNVILGVIEVVQDLSHDYEGIVRLQGMIIGTSFIIMALLFVVLWFIVARADAIIELRAKERSRLEVKLHQSERLASLGKMVASVSHEIKNPLGIVRSTGEILQKRMKKVAPENEHLAQVVVEETIRLDGIVREFLDFARPKPLRLENASVNDLITRALTFLGPNLEKSKISTESHLDKSLPELAIDQEMIYRALLNIVINSKQAMPDGGTLTVASRRAAGRNAGVVIEISDTGVGMEKDKVRKIFNPFFTDKHRGTGLGLAIVKNIIDQHRGEIEVESEPEKGTIFRITLR